MTTPAQAQGTDKTLITLAVILAGGFLLVKYGPGWFGKAPATGAAPGGGGGGGGSFPDQYEPTQAASTDPLSSIISLLGGLFTPKGGNVSIGGPSNSNPSGSGSGSQSSSAYDAGIPSNAEVNDETGIDNPIFGPVLYSQEESAANTSAASTYSDNGPGYESSAGYAPVTPSSSGVDAYSSGDAGSADYFANADDSNG